MKDLEQNAKALGLVTVLGLVIGIGIQLFSGSSAGGAEGFLVGAEVLGLPIMFSMWLVGQEKAKGTIQILRSLPVSGTEIMFAKWTLTILYTALATVVLELFVPLFIPASQGLHASARTLVTAWIVSCSMMICGIFFSLFIVIDQKIATQIAWIGTSAVFFALSKIVEMPGIRRMLHSEQHRSLIENAKHFGFLIPILIGVGVVFFAGRYVEQTDIADLKEV